MSEANERNPQSVAPEAAESARERETGAKAAPEEAPAKKGKSEPGKKKKKGKKKNKNSIALPLAIVLVIALVIFGVLVGYGVGRVRSERERQAEEPGASATQEPAYDAFTEALTQENEQALEALSGAGEEANANLSLLMGEDALFTGDSEQESGEESEEEPVVVAEYGDGEQILSSEVMEAYNEELAMHILTGSSEEEVADTLLSDVLREAVSDRVQEEHAKELGLYELSDEDHAQIEAQAAEDYEEYVEFYRESEIDDEGMSEEEAETAAKAQLMESEGVTYESLVAQLEAGRWEQKLFDYVTGSVSVDDAAVQAAYAERLAEQQANFNEYPDDFEFAQWSGDLILYNLPGYRAMKLLLVGFEDEDAAATVNALTDELGMLEADIDEAERQETLDACYAEPEARAQELLAQLRGGADMDEMISAYGEDEGMKDAQRRARGYYFSEDSSRSEALVSAAMALENVGDFSEPVRVSEGVAILQYIGDVPEGPVPLEDVREELSEEVLSEARNDAYNAQVRTWLQEANPTFYPERMQ